MLLKLEADMSEPMQCVMSSIDYRLKQCFNKPLITLNAQCQYHYPIRDVFADNIITIGCNLYRISQVFPSIGFIRVSPQIAIIVSN